MKNFGELFIFIRKKKNLKYLSSSFRKAKKKFFQNVNFFKKGVVPIQKSNKLTNHIFISS